MKRFFIYLGWAVAIAAGIYYGGRALYLWIERRRKEQANGFRLIRQQRHQQALEAARLVEERRPRIGFQTEIAAPATT